MGLAKWGTSLQGYLAHKKHPSSLEPLHDPRKSPTVGSQGGVVSYERGTHVINQNAPRNACMLHRMNTSAYHFAPLKVSLSGVRAKLTALWGILGDRKRLQCVARPTVAWLRKAGGGAVSWQYRVTSLMKLPPGCMVRGALYPPMLVPTHVGTHVR